MENENTQVEATEEKPSAEDVKSILAGIKSRIRVTKVTATRSAVSYTHLTLPTTG